MRQRAWLAATPTKWPKSRHAHFIEMREKGNPVPDLDLPPVKAGAHLVRYLLEVGPTAGGEALSYAEIAAWKGQTGTVLDAWSTTTLRSLSQAYLAEYYAAVSPQRPSPSQAAAPERVETFQALSSALDRMEAQQNRRGA